jgi:hypothetical protein
MSEESKLHPPNFLSEMEFSRRYNIPYTTLHMRVISGDIDLHLVDRCVVIDVDEAIAVMAKVKRRPRRSPVINDLFSAA